MGVKIMAKFTKEELETLGRMVGLSEETIQEAWQEVLRIRAKEAQKTGTHSPSQSKEESGAQQSDT